MDTKKKKEQKKENRGGARINGGRKKIAPENRKYQVTIFLEAKYIKDLELLPIDQCITILAHAVNATRERLEETNMLHF